MKNLSLIFGLLILVGCNGGKNQTNIELVTDMMDQESIKSQDWDPAQGDKVQMRQPPKGTIPQDFEVYPYGNDAEAAGKGLKNPYASLTPESLELGNKYFQIYCSVCHGHKGEGDGTVAEKMAVRPPSLLTDKVKGYPDGRIFHIITKGQGVMGSYASQVTDVKTRWAIVNYVRSLQKGMEKGN